MAPARVPSDGRPHRFPAFEFEVPFTEQRLVKGELAEAVIVRTEHDNGAALPLLPGPVDLVRDSGLVGRTWLDFTAPGETFELGWGPDLALREALSVGDWVSTHWGWVCERLTTRDLSNLAAVTRHNLRRFWPAANPDPGVAMPPSLNAPIRVPRPAQGEISHARQR
mgnify:CR=1 FL=1